MASNSFLEYFGWSLKRTTKAPEDIKAGYIKPDNDDAAFVVGAGGYYGSYASEVSYDANLNQDFALIHKYRQTALHPEVDRAINEIVNEAIDGSGIEKPAKLNLDNLQQSQAIKDRITDEFEKILILMNFNHESYEIFRKWYVDGKMYYYMIIDPKDSDKGIQELRYISPLHIKKMREDKTELKNGIPIVVSSEEYFVYSTELRNTSTPISGGIKLTTDSVAYCTSGFIDEHKNLVYSYLQRSTRPCNQLRMIEDAITIYRLARAPERRVFKIPFGNMPKGKAEEYIRSMQARYKNKMVYDSANGEVKDSVNNLSMLEDYWIPVSGDGKGVDISVLQGAQNLGEIEDLNYFRKKLFESLGVPLGRLMSDASPPAIFGNSQLVSREEVNFGSFIERLRDRFANIFMDILRMQLILTKVISPEEWDSIKEELSVDFASNTYFAEMKDSEILRERLSTLQIVDPTGPYLDRYFSRAWIKKNILKFDDDMIKKMQEEIDDEEGERERENEMMQAQAAAMAPPMMPGEEEPLPPESDPNALLPQQGNGPESAPPYDDSGFGGSKPKKTKKTV